MDSSDKTKERPARDGPYHRTDHKTQVTSDSRQQGGVVDVVAFVTLYMTSPGATDSLGEASGKWPRPDFWKCGHIYDSLLYEGTDGLINSLTTLPGLFMISLDDYVLVVLGTFLDSTSTMCEI